MRVFSGSEKRDGGIAMNEQGKKLGTYLKVSYGLADYGFMFMVTMSNTFLLMFYTDYAGITAAAAGTLMMVGRIIDSISPPIIGAAIEKSNLRWGKYRSWVLIGAPLILLLNGIMFTNNSMDMIPKAITACIIYAAFCISTNIAYTGYTSLSSSLTDDPKERVHLSTFRGQGGAIGKIFAGFFILPLIVFFGNGKENVSGFTWTAFLVGLICFLCYMNLIYASKGKDIQNKPVKVSTGGQEKLKVGQMVSLVFHDKNLLLLFFADITRILSLLITYAMFPYFFQYVAKNKEATSTFFGIVNILALVGATSVPLITKFLSKKNAYMVGNLILSVCMLISIVFSSNITFIIIMISIGYLGYSWPNVVNINMYADTVDYCEWKTGRNARGVYFSLFQLSIKIAAVFSTAIAGFGLSMVGYVGGTEPSTQVVTGIRFMAMGLPAAFLIISTALMFFYTLTPKKMDQVREELIARRANG